MHSGSIKTFIATGFALSVSAAALAQDVRVVVSGQVTPGVYGRVEVGTNPPPPVVNPRPVVVIPPPVVVQQPVVVTQPVVVHPPVVVAAPAPTPVYMHVPPGHAKHWRHHCHRYNACTQPVYFVRSAEFERRGGGRHRGH